jgi:DtxR family transcriptional regulator, Mn-dependent transcriptional regulator
VVEASLAQISDSMQMYLVTIVRLRTNGQPVPLSQLAKALSISSVSVNEMCHKLQDDGLLVYRPYKGASLTEEGEQRAFHILRRHRLWEVFLVDKLGFDYEQAHEAACQLEHATPDQVADQLDVFLGHPTVNPQGEPIPRADGGRPSRPLTPLTALSAGQRGHVVRCDVSEAAQAFLSEQGIRPGAKLTVEAVGGARSEPVEGGSILVLVAGTRVSLARSLAEGIQLDKERTEEVDGEVRSTSPQSTSTVAKTEEDSDMQTKVETAVRQIPLHKLKAGQRGIVVRVGGKGPAKRRMMDMGLVPGSDVEVVRVAPLGDPIEFTVKGYSLSLRKSEAKRITVEVKD